LVGNDDLLNKGAFDIFHSYNVEQLIPVDVSGKGYKSILCKYAEIDSTHYLDPRSNLVLTVDHTKGVVTDTSDNTSSEKDDVRRLREPLQKAVDEYVADQYLQGVSTVFPSDSSREFIVCIGSSKFNEKNFWSGRWRSVWRVSYEDKKVKISGSMKVNIHYYEKGNIQLNTSKDYAEVVNSAGDDDTPAQLCKVLVKVENNFMKDIDTTCNNLSETFKGLRRRLPMTKTLFSFESNQHKLVESFGKK